MRVRRGRRLTNIPSARCLAAMGFGTAGLALSTSILSASEMDVFSTPTVIESISRAFLNSLRRFSIWTCRATNCLNHSEFLLELVLLDRDGDERRGGG